MVKKFLGNAGQSVVEYILLLAVVMTIMITIMNSDYFKSLLGPESQVFEVMRQTMEYTYRHGRFGTKGVGEDNYDGTHESYYDGSNSRFFSPQVEYP